MSVLASLKSQNNFVTNRSLTYAVVVLIIAMLAQLMVIIGTRPLSLRPLTALEESNMSRGAAEPYFTENEAQLRSLQSTKPLNVDPKNLPEGLSFE